jgi:hypothetical protein
VSQLQLVERVSELVTWTVPVTSEYSGQAAVFREELQSCRRTDPVIWKRGNE